MASLEFTLLADFDTETILTDLTTNAGKRVAEAFFKRFESLFLRLANHPEIGAPRPKLGKDIRIGIVSPFVVIYRYTEASDLVTVLRIIHGRRRISGRLLPYPEHH